MGIGVRHTNQVVVRNGTHTESTTLFVFLLGRNGRKDGSAIVARLIAYIRVGFLIPYGTKNEHIMRLPPIMRPHFVLVGLLAL